MKETYFSNYENEYINCLVHKYCNIPVECIEYFSINEYEYLQYLIFKYYNIKNVNLKYFN